MYRFIAFTWNSRDSAKADTVHRLGCLLLSTSSDWQCVLNTPGLQVFQARHARGARHAYVLQQRAGVVLGRLFESDAGEDRIPSGPVFDEIETASVIESRGRRLVERYWGHYVAFLRDPDSERRFIIRDPTGGVPCFLVEAAGINVILSDIEDCARLNLTPLSVDWDHLITFFLHSRLITRSTGFKEVSQLYAGECATIDDGGVTRSFYWNPVDVYEADTIEDAEEARVALRTTIRHCVDAWASCYGSIVHELSGGLDSSVVAACLGKSSPCPAVVCFHYFTEMSEGDERAYARAAARRAGFELIERQCPVSEKTLQSQLDTAKVATPAVLGFLPPSELLKQRLVAERNAGAVFTGQGGDQLFQQQRDILIAAEYAHRHGIRPHLLSIAADASRLTKQSIWATLIAATSHGRLRHPFDPYAFYYKSPSVLTDEARASLSRSAYTHPWIDDAKRLPASKISQVFNVVDCQPFYQVSRPNVEQVHPLISQPVIERALQIPSYILAHRGRARGLIREGFEADLPAKIIHRYSKGATTSYFNRMVVENASFLRDLLLDGVLVSEGVLDRCELQKYLSERELILGNGMRPLLNAARAETWLRNWENVRQRSAA